MTKLLILLAMGLMLLACSAIADDERETLRVITSPEKAKACLKEGCGLYTREEIQAVQQRARAEALMDVARLLNNKGCLRDDRT